MQIALGISNISYQHLCSAVKQKITKKKIFCMIRDKVDVGDVRVSVLAFSSFIFLNL